MSKVYSLPYGPSAVQFKLPDGLKPEPIEPPIVQAHPAPQAAIREALLSPLGPVPSSRLAPGCRVAVAVLDGSRPDVNTILLPPLLAWLDDHDIQREDVQLHIATGIHPQPLAPELELLLPEAIIDGCIIHDHDADDRHGQRFLGTTSRGTPVWIDHDYLDADYHIALGIIAPHQFQGFSGGVKAAAIGLAGRETIEHNHALMTNPQSCLGSYATNPARQDVEEIGQLADIHLALNLILNCSGEIISALAGEPQSVMHAGIPIAKEASCRHVDHLFDLTIASCGGHPRDINLYQAQKALAHACLITRTGGVVILVAACSQGSGSELFEETLRERPTPAQVIDRFESQGFKLGAHKAYQIARDVRNRTVFLVSELDDEQARTYLLQPVDSIEAALDQLGSTLEVNHVGLMPWASTTIPLLHQ